MFNFKSLVAGLVFVFALAAPAFAANKVPLKPDGANAAPCTVYGTPYNGMSCGKTSAPAEVLDVVGNGLFSGNLTGALHVSSKTALTGIYVSTTIAVTSSYETVLSSGGAIGITATPSIATSGVASGTILVLTSTTTANNVILQDEGTLTGSKLQLGAATRTITQYKTLMLVYDATDGYWREIAFGAN